MVERLKTVILTRDTGSNFFNSTTRKRSWFDSRGLYQTLQKLLGSSIKVMQWALTLQNTGRYRGAQPRISKSERVGSGITLFGVPLLPWERCDDPCKLINDVYNKIVLWPTGLHGVVACLSRKRVRGDRYPCRSPIIFCYTSWQIKNN